MRRAPRVDSNQAEVVAALRAIGATVQSLAAVGAGCPDLLVGYRGRNWLVEIKRPPGPRGGMKGRRLRETQIRWRDAWRGQVARVESPEEALALVSSGNAEAAA